MENKNLFEQFSVIKDPRYNIGKKHQMIDIIIMTIYGILNGITDFTNIAEFLKINEKYFIKLLDLKYGVPSHDTISFVFELINPNEFMSIFIVWIKDIIKTKTQGNIQIDGKAVRDAADTINGGNIPYIVSAFLGNIGISLGQVKVDDKSNEMKAIPKLLELIDITGATITMDAAGTYSFIADKIISKGAHYVLPVKGNQPTLLENIALFFDDLELKRGCEYFNTGYEKDHGRIEKREYFLTHDIDGIISDVQKWKSVNAIGMALVYREEKGKTTITPRYYIIDYKISMSEFVKATRGQWDIECGLHYKLDVIFNEDHSRNRVGSSIENLSTIRKIAFNLANLDDRFGKVPMKRKLLRYTYNFSLIEDLIFNPIIIDRLPVNT
jgi:predicted transposase YbfD/YdcC